MLQLNYYPDLGAYGGWGVCVQDAYSYVSASYLESHNACVPMFVSVLYPRKILEYGVT